MENMAKEVSETAWQGSAGQYLSFTLEGEDYGVDILKVQEIRGWEAVREIPDTPSYIKGVLDLRGRIVPIVDLRERFTMQAVEYTATTVIVVLSVRSGAELQLMGVVVDAVSDVLDVEGDEIRQPPSFGSKINTRYMGGMLKREQRMIVLLDVDRLLDPEQFHELEHLD